MRQPPVRSGDSGSGSAPCPPREPRPAAPARPASRPLSPPHSPSRPSWVRPAAPQPNNAPPHRPSPCRTSQQPVLLLAGRGRSRGRGRGGEGRGLSGRGCRLLAESDFGRPASGPADRAGSSAWGRALAGPYASSLKQVWAAPAHPKPLGHSFIVDGQALGSLIHLSLVRLLEGRFAGRAGARSKGSVPGPSRPEAPGLSLPDSPTLPADRLCPCAQSLGPGWQPGWGQDSEACGS